MAKADVELAIRARDEASAAIKGVKDSVKDLSDEQRALVAAVRGASKELGAQETALNRVTDKLAKAEGQFAGLQQEMAQEAAVAATLNDQFKQLTSEVDRLKGEFATAAAPVKALGAELAASVERSRNLADENRKLAVTNDEIKKSISAAKAEFKPFADAVAAAAQGVSAAKSELAGANKEFGKAGTEAEKAKAAFASLEASGEKLSARLAKSKQSLADLNAELAKVGAKRNAAGAFDNSKDEVAYDRLAAKVAKATASVQSNQAALTAFNTKLAQSGQRIESAASAYDAAGKAAAAAQANFAKQEAVLTAAKDSAEKAAAGLNTLNAALAENQARVAANSVENRKLISERQALNAQLATATAAQKDANAALQSAERDAAKAGAQAKKQADAVAKLGLSAQTAASATAQLTVEQKALEAGVSRAAQALQQQSAGLVKVAGSAKQAGQGLSLFNDTGRTTLSFQQRLRGQVLQLVAAYGGLYGAVSLVQKGLALQQQESGTQARLNVLFDGDGKKAAQELVLLRAEADRLGITYQDLAEQYSKVAVSAVKSGATIEQTRTVFFGISEAAKALGTSTEQNQRIFTAINQIFSKGKLTAEELSGQLGDAMPAAIAVMAKSLGIGEDKLRKLMETTGISSQALINFAITAKKEFGEGLAGQVGSITSELQRTQTVLNDMTKSFNEGFFVGFAEALIQLRDALGGPEGMTKAFKELGRVMGSIVLGAVEMLKVIRQLLPVIVGFGAAWAAAKLASVVGGLVGVTGSLTLMKAALLESEAVLRALPAALTTVEAGASRTAIVVRGLAAAFNTLAAALFAGAFGYAIGQFLNQFKPFQKLGVNLIKMMKELGAAGSAAGERFVVLKGLLAGDLDVTGYLIAIDDINARQKKAMKEIAETTKQMKADIESGATDLSRPGGAAGGAGFDSKAFLAEQEKIAAAQTEANKKVLEAAAAADKAAKARDKAAKAALDEASALEKLKAALESVANKSRDLVDREMAFDAKIQGALTDGVEATLNSRLVDAQLKVDEFRRESNAIEADLRAQIAKIQALLDDPKLKLDAGQRAGLVGQQAQLNAGAEAVAGNRDDYGNRLKAKLDGEARLSEAQAVAAQLEQQRSLQLAENSRKAQAEKWTEVELNQANNAVIEETAYGLENAYLEASRYADAIGQPTAAEALRGQAAAVRDELIPSFDMMGTIVQGTYGALIDGITQFTQAAVQGFAEALTGAQSWGDALQGVGNAFRSFASGVLKQIAQMIIQYAILRAIAGAGLGGFSAFANNQLGGAGIPASVNHNGGVIGRSGFGGTSRLANPAWFASAQRFHSGGLPGLKKDEVPAILQTGEEVLSRNDPRNVMNGAGGGSKPQDIKIINTIESGSMVASGIATREGEKAILNFVRANKSAFKQVLA